MPAGRPTTLTPDVQVAILEALRKGHTQTVAASIAGVPYQTLVSWLKRGREEQSDCLFSQFAREVDSASEAGYVACEECLIRGGQNDPRIALAILERRLPREWGKRVEVTGKDGGAVKVEVVGDLASALDALATGADGDSGDRAE